MQDNTELKRAVGILGATMMGLGSIVGTGVFVSIAIAVEIAGSSIIVAIILASLVAICNGLSSAQLAANHPVSGGTYEYGYRRLNSRIGFVAGWTFLIAKSASAATAALGFSLYLAQFFDWDNQWSIVSISLCTIATITVIAVIGIKRNSALNIIIVSITLTGLMLFLVGGANHIWQTGERKSIIFSWKFDDLLQSTALMFVAFTGYGRIATLGEEIKQPRVNIPRAIITTLVVSMLLYVAVAHISVSLSVEEATLNISTGSAPLVILARHFSPNWIASVVAISAMSAMLGVLLNLILGLSRVLLAMGRRNDMPPIVATVANKTNVPIVATLVVSLFVATITLLGDIKLAWSFSAFTVLIYYSITNACALRLSPDERVYPVWPAWFGLTGCLFLAFWVEPFVWSTGLGIIAMGLVWKEVCHRVFKSPVMDKQNHEKSSH
ncbi:MAG: amino acid permease [Planctomycetota bacterium]